MTLKPLYACILISMPLASLHAAALDRSGQSILNLFQPGDYVEVSYAYLSPEVSGVDNNGNRITEMAKDYQLASASLKVQPSEQFSFALLYDEPFGAEAEFQGNNNFVSSNGERTSVELNSNNLTALLGFKPMPNVTLYAGPALQYMKGDVALRGAAYQVFDGYDAKIRGDAGLGYVAGAAFEMPDIALRVALTYRSEIDHSFDTRETNTFPFDLALAGAVTGAATGQPTPFAPILVAAGGNVQAAAPTIQAAALGAAANPALSAEQRAGAAQIAGLAAAVQQPLQQSRGVTKISTPQSVNLDFQTGIMADTLMFGHVRWVEWSGVQVRPPMFEQTANAAAGRPLNLLDYTDDQWSASLGVGRKLNQQWSGNVAVGWDSGAGDPITTLGPTVGFWSLGVGARYSPVENIDVSLGVRYLWLGDAVAKVSSGTEVGRFEDNTAIAAGLKLGYRF